MLSWSGALFVPVTDFSAISTSGYLLAKAWWAHNLLLATGIQQLFIAARLHSHDILQSLKAKRILYSWSWCYRQAAHRQLLVHTRTTLSLQRSLTHTRPEWCRPFYSADKNILLLINNPTLTNQVTNHESMRNELSPILDTLFQYRCCAVPSSL